MTGEPVHNPSEPETASESTAVGDTPPTQAAQRTQSRSAKGVQSGSHRPVARIDNHTKRSARIGLQQARAALSEANRRVAEREAERLAEREQEFLALSDAARRLALVASAPEQPRTLPSADSLSEAPRSAA
jgi:hypothetical protein